MKKYTNNEINKIAIEKYSKDYEMFQGQVNWFIKGFREALSQHDVSGRSELLRDYFKWHKEQGFVSHKDSDIDEFLSSN